MTPQGSNSSPLAAKRHPKGFILSPKCPPEAHFDIQRAPFGHLVGTLGQPRLDFVIFWTSRDQYWQRVRIHLSFFVYKWDASDYSDPCPARPHARVRSLARVACYCDLLPAAACVGPPGIKIGNTRACIFTYIFFSQMS